MPRNDSTIDFSLKRAAAASIARCVATSRGAIATGITLALLWALSPPADASQRGPRRQSVESRKERVASAGRAVEQATASSTRERREARTRPRSRRSVASPLRDLRKHALDLRAASKRESLGRTIVESGRSPMFEALFRSFEPIVGPLPTTVEAKPRPVPGARFDTRLLRRVQRELDAKGSGSAAKTGAVLSAGVALTGADSWQSIVTDPLGLPRENPVRIAILDLGFEGYASLLGTELPAAVTTFDAAPFWDIEGCSGPPPCIPEGTAMAEVVADVAPDAELVLIAFDRGSGPDDLGSLSDAVDYLVSGGPGGVRTADIVVSGISWESGFFGDAFGTGPVVEQIARARNAGITWIHDSGDALFLRNLYYGAEPAVFGHWTGTFEDEFDHVFFLEPGQDGYMDVWLGSEDPASGPTYLNRFCLGPDDEMLFELVWDDWVDADDNGLPEPTQDFSIDIYEDVGGTPVFLDTSEGPAFNEQSGSEGQFPWDSLNIVNTDIVPVCFFVSVFATSADINASNRFHLYWSGDQSGGGAFTGVVSGDFDPIERDLPAGSRMIPADTPGLRLATATTVDEALFVDPVEPFAALPFDSERSRNVCSPDDVETDTLSTTFLTAFGAAHVAGAVALMMDKVGSVDTSEAWQILSARARDILGPGDHRCGTGRLCMLTDGCAP